MGQAAKKTKGIMDKAIGKVLFIDEAYGLNPNHGGSGASFMQEVSISRYKQSNYTLGDGINTFREDGGTPTPQFVVSSILIEPAVWYSVTVLLIFCITFTNPTAAFLDGSPVFTPTLLVF